MRIACVLIHNLAIQVALTGDATLCSQPLVLGGLPFEAKTVYDASFEATACGIKPGMSLRQAYALCPDARFLPADESQYEQVFEEVVDVLERFSPVVDIEELGCAYLDVGRVHGEENPARKISTSLSTDTGLNGCIGISNGKFLSRAAAFTSKPEAPVIVPEGEEKDFIAPFPIDFLSCPAEIKERLYLLGIRFMGQLSQFSREALAAQFGSEGIILHQLAHGIDETPLSPRKKPELITVAADLEPPASIYLQILHACQVMLDRPLDKVKAEGKACREIAVKVIFPSGASYQRRLPLKQVTVSISVILDRLRTWLESITFPASVTRVELSLSLSRETGKSLYLWPEQKKSLSSLNALAHELKSRFGYQPLKKVQIVDAGAILPERRFRLTDVLD